MGWFKDRKVRAAAQRDAAAGVESGEEHVIGLLGYRPVVNVVDNYEQGAMARRTGLAVDVAEGKEDLDRSARELGRHAHPTGLGALVLGFVVVEMIGGVLAMRGIGTPPAERLPLGIALALSLIALTAVTSNRTAPPVEGAAAPRASGTVVVFVAYTIFVVGLAFVRLRASSDDDGGLAALPGVIMMLATTLGPAWLAEHFLRQRRASSRVYGEVGRLKRHIRTSDRERRRGDRFFTQIASAQSTWDSAAARLRAIYQSEYRRARGELGFPSTNTRKPRRPS